MHQLRLQPAQNPRLDIAPLDRLAIGACPGVPCRRAAQAAIADHDIARPAAAAGQKPRQQIARAMPTFDLGAVGIGYPFGPDIVPDCALPMFDPTSEVFFDHSAMPGLSLLPSVWVSLAGPWCRPKRDRRGQRQCRGASQ